MLGHETGQDRIGVTNARHGWQEKTEKNSAYVCDDGLEMQIKSKTFRLD